MSCLFPRSLRRLAPDAATDARPDSHRATLEALGNIIDADEGFLCGGGYPGCAYLDSLTVSGDCRPTYAFSCSCLGGVELDIYRAAASGTCVVTINVKNQKGAVGTSIFTVPYHQGTGSPAAAPSQAPVR